MLTICKIAIRYIRYIFWLALYLLSTTRISPKGDDFSPNWSGAATAPGQAYNREAERILRARLVFRSAAEDGEAHGSLAAERFFPHSDPSAAS
jgi:hypothetical protein